MEKLNINKSTNKVLKEFKSLDGEMIGLFSGPSLIWLLYYVISGYKILALPIHVNLWGLTVSDFLGLLVLSGWGVVLSVVYFRYQFLDEKPSLKNTKWVKPSLRYIWIIMKAVSFFLLFTPILFMAVYFQENGSILGALFMYLLLAPIAVYFLPIVYLIIPACSIRDKVTLRELNSKIKGNRIRLFGLILYFGMFRQGLLKLIESMISYTQSGVFSTKGFNAYVQSVNYIPLWGRVSFAFAELLFFALYLFLGKVLYEFFYSEYRKKEAFRVNPT